MSQTVSFVARDELAEWLEERADREMKSLSAVCQDIVVEAYHRENQTNTDKDGQTNTGKDGQTEQDGPLTSSEALSQLDLSDDDPLVAHAKAWYEPDGKHDYAVRDPDAYNENGGTRYYNTLDGVRERLKEWYE